MLNQFYLKFLIIIDKISGSNQTSIYLIKNDNIANKN